MLRLENWFRYRRVRISVVETDSVSPSTSKADCSRTRVNSLMARDGAGEEESAIWAIVITSKLCHPVTVITID